LRWLLAGLLLLLVVLQYRLWIAEGSLAERHRLERQIEEQARINQELQVRNDALEREVLDLQTGNKGLEQRAREQLGLIRDGETFYQFVKSSPGTAEPADAPPPAAEQAP
jgi:cell division protein FtsB